MRPINAASISTAVIAVALLQISPSESAPKSPSKPKLQFMHSPMEGTGSLSPVLTYRSSSDRDSGARADMIARREAALLRMVALREKAIRRGMKLMDAHEVLQEVARRRGELET